MTRRPRTFRRVAGGIGRRVSLRPLRPLFPYAVWRPVFRLWLGPIRAQGPRVTYAQADAIDYAPEDPVDVAVLSNVLEHIEPRVDLLRALRERADARRLLLPVPVLDRDWTVPLRRELGLDHFSDPEHKVEYDPELLRAELAAAGWQMAEPQLVWGEIWVEASPAG